MKIVLDQVNILMAALLRSNALRPPILRPIVSKTENVVLRVKNTQESVLFRLYIQFKVVSNATAGNTTKVNVNTYMSANSSPSVFMKLTFAMYRKFFKLSFYGGFAIDLYTFLSWVEICVPITELLLEFSLCNLRL